MIWNRRYQSVLTVSVLCVSAAAVTSFIIPPPDGLWAGIYLHYWLVWTLLGGSLISALALIQFTSLRIPWKFIIPLVLLNAWVVTSLTHVWGVPYTHHDVWVQMSYAKFGILDAQQNPYPFLHIISIIISRFGVPYNKIFTIGNSFTILLIVLFAGIALRRMPGSCRAKQTAFIVGIPAWLVSLTVRPISLAWPFLFLIIWLVADQTRAHHASRYSILVLLLITLPWIHPEVGLFVAIFFIISSGLGFVLLHFDQWLPELRLNGNPMNVSKPTFPIGIAFLGVAIAYLVFYNEIAVQNIGGRAISLLYGGDGGIAVTSQVSGTQKAISTFQAAYEAVRRLSYIILISISIIVGGIQSIRYRFLDHIPAIIFLTAISISFVFVTVDTVFNSTGLSITRLIAILPSLLIFPSIRMFGGSRTVAFVVAFLVLTSGMLIIFPSDYTGSVGLSPTKEQVSGTEWLANTPDDKSIVGTSSTFWLAQGIFGPERIEGWSTREGDPKRVPQYRDAEYAWQVKNHEESYFVIDETSIAIARRNANELDNLTVINELRQFRSQTSRIYANGDMSIYRKHTSVFG